MASGVLCHAYGQQPRVQKRATYKQISKLVKKTDGTRPAEGALAKAVETFMKAKKNQEENKARKKKQRKRTTGLLFCKPSNASGLQEAALIRGRFTKV